jgi:hypothetical protein
MKRILLAGILGAIAMFVWTSVSHMVLPLGTVGIKEIPNEAPVLTAMNASVGTANGLYMFPGMGLGENPSMQQMRDAMPAYEKKLATSPSGILIYHPPGPAAAMGPMLAIEFGKELGMTLLATALLAMTRLESYGSKVGFFAVIGLIAAMVTNVSYWNWYRFPGNYTLSYMFVEFMGFLVAGLAVAAVMRTGKASDAAA